MTAARCPRCDRAECPCAVPGSWRLMPHGHWAIWRNDEIGFDMRYTTQSCTGEAMDWRAEALKARAGRDAALAEWDILKRRGDRFVAERNAAEAEVARLRAELDSAYEQGREDRGAELQPECEQELLAVQTERDAAHDECARLRAALAGAALSLEALARAGARGGPDTLVDLIDVRGYAGSRAKAARAALGEEHD